MPPTPLPRRSPLPTVALAAFALGTPFVHGPSGPVSAAAHGDPAAAHRSEQRQRAEENRTLGPRHAAEHAAQRQGLRAWGRLPPAERERRRQRARRAAARAVGPTGSADQVGRWSSTTVPFRNWPINAVVLPTGKVAYWGRGALGTGYGGGRDNTGLFYVWDPVSGRIDEHPPPDVYFDRDGDGIEDEWGPAPLFCSGQSLLASGELYVAGGNRFAPGVREDGQGNRNPEYAGWWGTYSFDPWTERWTVQPNMRHGRWYPTQVQLPDGRIAITTGYDEHGRGADNDTMEIFTPHPERGGVGTLRTVPAGYRDTASYYPHMFVVPGGNVLLAGPGQHDSAFLDPARIDDPGSGAAWAPHGSSSRFRVGSSAALLPPTGPGRGSEQAMLLGGYRGEDLDSTGLERATAVVETTNVRPGSPAWRAGRAGEPPNLNVGRANGNLVQLPTGGFVFLGGAAGFQRGSAGPEASNATVGRQELKNVELWNPGEPAWRVGPASRKWRSYHSTAVLLPDGRILSAGDDYWGLDDTPHQGYADPQDHGELYEPAYLFDGDRPAPRPRVTGGPSAVRWGATFGVGVAEVAGRPIERVTLVGPGAVTHGVDMNRKFAELEIVRRTPGGGVDVRAPSGPDLAPPGWYMLFAIDVAGTPAAAHWVQIGGDLPPGSPGGPPAPDGGGGPAPGATPGGAPAPGRVARDVRGPRVGLVVQRPNRRTRALRIRVGADEPARVRLRIRVEGRVTARTLRLRTKRLGQTIRVPLTAAQRARLRQRKPLRLRIRSDARDAAGNVATRALRLRVRAGRATRSG